MFMMTLRLFLRNKKAFEWALEGGKLKGTEKLICLDQYNGF
jgi:hypothetical protein